MSSDQCPIKSYFDRIFAKFSRCPTVICSPATESMKSDVMERMYCREGERCRYCRGSEESQNEIIWTRDEGELARSKIDIADKVREARIDEFVSTGNINEKGGQK